MGARGLVCVASNLVPEHVVAMWRAFESGDLAQARRWHLRLLPLFTGLFMETNPAPVKAAVAWATGLCEPDVRLPLTQLTAAGRSKLLELCRGLEIPVDHRSSRW